MLLLQPLPQILRVSARDTLDLRAFKAKGLPAVGMVYAKVAGILDKVRPAELQAEDLIQRLIKSFSNQVGGVGAAGRMGKWVGARLAGGAQEGQPGRPVAFQAGGRVLTMLWRGGIWDVKRTAVVRAQRARGMRPGIWVQEPMLTCHFKERQQRSVLPAGGTGPCATALSPSPTSWLPPHPPASASASARRC